MAYTMTTLTSETATDRIPLIMYGDLQKQDPKTKVVLFQIGYDGYGLFFHNQLLKNTDIELEAAAAGVEIKPKAIVFNSVNYSAWPCKIEGLEMTSDGSAPSPTLTVGNANGAISQLCLANNNMLGRKVTITTTLYNYLDAVNFVDGNPDADPTQKVESTWYVEQKLSEDDTVVVFALSSPADFDGRLLPARQITAYCDWCLKGDYRRTNCNYMSSRCYDANGNPVGSIAEDVCGGTLADCKIRFTKGVLPFGGFPASEMVIGR